MIGEDVFTKTLPRIAKLEVTSGISFEDALNTAVEAIYLFLWGKRSDIVKKNLDSYADIDPFSMPVDFRGFAEDPYLVASDRGVVKLAPLPSGGSTELYGTSGTPAYYRLTGNEVQLFPAPVAEYDMRGEYFACPPALTFSSTLPWHGLFDGLIVDGVVEATKFGGLTALMANQAFMATMELALFSILASRTNPAPRRSRPSFF